MPKLDRCASPQSWTLTPESGVAAAALFVAVVVLSSLESTITLSACPWATCSGKRFRTTTLDTTDRRAPPHHPDGMKRRHGHLRVADYSGARVGRPTTDLSQNRRTHIDHVTRLETADPRLRSVHRTCERTSLGECRRAPIGTSGASVAFRYPENVQQSP